MGTAALTLTWAFFRLTESKGRTFEELDIMFGEKLPTRKFATFKVDAYAGHHEKGQTTNVEVVEEEHKR